MEFPCNFEVKNISLCVQIEVGYHIFENNYLFISANNTKSAFFSEVVFFPFSPPELYDEAGKNFKCI